MKKIGKIIICFSIIGILLTISGCSNKENIEKQLIGAWYLEDEDSPAFTLYDDGTCELSGEYGTGTWALVNDNQLKITNFYGETEVIDIIGIEGGHLTLGTEGDSATIQLWNENNQCLDGEEDSSSASNIAAHMFTDFHIRTESNRIAVIQWTNEDGLTDRGLMDCNGNVFFKFPESYPDVNAIADNYIYGGKGLIAMDGTLLYQFPEDSDFSITSYGNNIFMVKQHIENMTENTIKLGFMRPDGSWIIEPSINVEETVNGHVGYYAGEGYFIAYSEDGKRLFINPETGHQLITDEFSSLEGVSDGVAVIDNRYGIDLQTGTEFEYVGYGSVFLEAAGYNGYVSIFSVADGYIAIGNKYLGDSYYSTTHIYNMRGELVLDLSEYNIMMNSYIHDGCLYGHLRGADEKIYVYVINIGTGDFEFEPVKAKKIVESGNYALIYMDDRSYYLNYADGSVEECEYPLSSESIQAVKIFEDMFGEWSGTYYSWENGKIKKITPYASFEK